ncbi:MAG TPA: crosslink repair DNA glycosylase YcaQ family protein [Anaerolineales bacterium]|nr:crosslink repair DNA glycosylase YcaQ family protein [Anaerolineales bacterium]
MNSNKLDLSVAPIVISKQTARRFVLGKQGLWPGRRWKGKKGTAQAIRNCEAVQLDPLNVIARSQDIVLHSRVLDYKPDYLYEVAYKDREFFDYGGWLAMYPMTNLPYFRVHMERRRHHERVEDFMRSQPELFEQVRAEVRTRGPLGNRHLDGNKVVGNYRGRKETSLALFDLWLTGELMIHHREGFERVYDFRENIAPKEYDYIVSEKEAEEFFIRKNISFAGLFREPVLRAALEGDMQDSYSREDAGKLIQAWLEAGKAARVQVEGGRDSYLVLAEDLAALASLEKGKVPKGWNPKEATTLEEVTFLAPLDIVSARGRAKKLFDFDYTWEVYTPVHKRRWGYYVLPILFGDDLVARLDPKLDRTTMTLEIKGFWHEDDAPVKDIQFADALAKGLARFAKFVGAEKVKTSAIQPIGLRKHVEQRLREAL